MKNEQLLQHLVSMLLIYTIYSKKCIKLFKILVKFWGWEEILCEEGLLREDGVEVINGRVDLKKYG